MLGTLISNIIAVVCFVVTLWGMLTKRIKLNDSLVIFCLCIFALGALLTWYEVFSIARQHGLL
jgi:Mg2+ and Co2+ transporter CorA